MRTLKGLRFHYLALADNDKEPFKRMLIEKELGWLATYDPDARVAVCIIGEHGVSSYLCGGSGKPSEAFARQQAKNK